VNLHRNDVANGGLGRPAEVPTNARSVNPAVDGETRAEIFLQPIAAPSILGWFGFAGATFMVAGFMAGWYGNARTDLFLFPFAAVFGGLAQFLAGMWAYRARDGLATAIHGTWGAFWMGFGLLFLLVAAGRLAAPTGQFGSFPALGYWFIVVAAVSWVCFAAAARLNVAMALTLLFMAVGSTLAAIYLLAGATLYVGWAAAYAFVAAAVLAWYTGSSLMLTGSLGREYLPLGRMSQAWPTRIATGLGEPGVIHGQ
jgi:succinate-acetate transporter protein